MSGERLEIALVRRDASLGLQLGVSPILKRPMLQRSTLSKFIVTQASIELNLAITLPTSFRPRFAPARGCTSRFWHFYGSGENRVAGESPDSRAMPPARRIRASLSGRVGTIHEEVLRVPANASLVLTCSGRTPMPIIRAGNLLRMGNPRNSLRGQAGVSSFLFRKTRLMT